MLPIDTTKVNHLAICRVGGTVFISCNGVTVSMQFDFGNITSTSDIGVARGGSYGYIGTVDAVRIKRGVALYTGTSYKVPLTLK